MAVVCCLQVQAQADSLAARQSLVPQQWNMPYGLHQGLNLSLSASVMAGFGKYAPKGAGFAQSLQATYLTPLTPKLTLMVGGYVGNLNWGRLNSRSAGIYGELSYQFNEHWEAHVYGQKNLLGHQSGGMGYLGMASGFGTYPLPLCGGMEWGTGWGYAADRLGAGVRYMPNKSFSVEVNVEKMWLPSQSYVPTTGGDFHQQVNAFGQQHGMPTQRP